jgi:hypothetical protein
MSFLNLSKQIYHFVLRIFIGLSIFYFTQNVDAFCMESDIAEEYDDFTYDPTRTSDYTHVDDYADDDDINSSDNSSSTSSHATQSSVKSLPNLFTSQDNAYLLNNFKFHAVDDLLDTVQFENYLLIGAEILKLDVNDSDIDMVQHLRFTNQWVNKILTHDRDVFYVSVNDRIKLSYWRMTTNNWLDQLEHVDRVKQPRTTGYMAINQSLDITNTHVEFVPNIDVTNGSHCANCYRTRQIMLEQWRANKVQQDAILAERRRIYVDAPNNALESTKQLQECMKDLASMFPPDHGASASLDPNSYVVKAQQELAKLQEIAEFEEKQQQLLFTALHKIDPLCLTVENDDSAIIIYNIILSKLILWFTKIQLVFLGLISSLLVFLFYKCKLWKKQCNIVKKCDKSIK